MNLTDALICVQTLDLDQTEAMRDIIRGLLGREVRRYSRKPLTTMLALNPSLRKCLKIAQELDKHDLRQLEIVADGLHKALSPKTHLRGGGIKTKKGENTGYGWLEWKSFSRIRIVTDPVTGDPGIEEYLVGPYPYWRMIASRGDRDKKRRVMKSIYLGNYVALALESEFITEEDIKKAALAGTIKQLKDRCKEEFERNED